MPPPSECRNAPDDRDDRDELAIMFCGRAFSACDKRSTRASKAYSAFHGL